MQRLFMQKQHNLNKRFALPEVERLPAIQWKILNLERMNPDKLKKAAAKLEKALFG